ncbi:thiamine biosynthesis lipoprotein [Desulfuromusa kysingii]|uniref:FAD:protein FMN transferase n=1 Tax=Desulfuromusa kysingii TaxID=37625 RepID=A0A1H4E180_9BACT|nr:FAD:protein FMN transferase [Desulfuromusa kysingii]SEA78162.1 thiamine biosynthesis lipoprotein [Desulfuromusa kysingii]
MKIKSLIIVIIVAIVGCIIYLNQNVTTQDQLVTLSGTTMGTSYHIKLAPAEGQKFNPKTIKAKIDERLSVIDHLMSTYKEDSDISKFNRAAVDSWMTVSTETMTVINEAQKISQLSHGAFDITIGNLVNLWGFGPTINIYELPDEKIIQALLPQVGYNKLEVQLSPPKIRKRSESVYLDLSGIAKGYAVDAVARLLVQNNIENFLVEIGGEIITHGHKQQQQTWVIGIESPVGGERVVRKRLHLPDVAMATSGDYRNYFEHEGVRYSHTIDPVTGYPIRHALASVTVIDRSCMRADALATAITVLGPDKGLEFATTHQLAVYMLVKQGDRFIEQHSSAFEPYLKAEED